MKNLIKAFAMLVVASLTLVGCGQRVEVPPAHIGKIMTKNGYQDHFIPSSKIRLDPCLMYCDKMVLLDVSDKSYDEGLEIFIPADKLKLGVRVRTTLSINPKKSAELFNSLSPEERNSYLSVIPNASIYQTYAKQIIQTEVREYLSTMSIAEIASSNEKVNSDIRLKLAKTIETRTPFTVRYVGITDIDYPEVITEAQVGAAKRREQIQQEQAQLEISKVTLERQLREAQLNRAIEKEKAETEAISQRTLSASITPEILELRRLEIQKLQAERWNGQLPVTIMGENTGTVPLFNVGK